MVSAQLGLASAFGALAGALLGAAAAFAGAFFLAVALVDAGDFMVPSLSRPTMDLIMPVQAGKLQSARGYAARIQLVW